VGGTTVVLAESFDGLVEVLGCLVTTNSTVKVVVVELDTFDRALYKDCRMNHG